MKTKMGQLGVGLIEVLVSLLILAVAILGFVAFQTNAVAITSESAVRTNALTVMRDLAESARYNKAGLADYKQNLNDFTDSFESAKAVIPFDSNKPTCGLQVISGTATNCTAAQQAEIEAYKAAKIAYENGFLLKMQSCPGTSNQVQCLVAAWNETTPTEGSASPHCIKTDGTYVAGSECMVINML